MPQNFKGFTLNKVGEKPKWSAREIQIFKDIIILLVPDKGTPLTDVHHHSNLYRSDDSAVALSVNATGRVNIAADSGTLPALSSDTFFVVNNNSAAGDNVGMSLIAGTTGSAIINFGDSGDENIGFIDYDNSDNSMSIGTNTTTAIHISSSQKVFISTQSGSASVLLHVNDGDSPPAFSADTLFAVTSPAAAGDNVAMSLISGTSGNTIINFGDNDDENIGYIDYDHNNNSLNIGVNVSTRLIIDSAGHTILGTTSGLYQLVVASSPADSTVAQFSNAGAANAAIRVDDSANTAFLGTQAGVAYFGNALGTNIVNLNIDTSGNAGLGVIAAAARLHVLHTTEQLRIGFDATNYMGFTVASGGDLNISHSGTTRSSLRSNGVFILSNAGSADSIGDEGLLHVVSTLDDDDIVAVAYLHQDSLTGNIAVLRMIQDDLNEPFTQYNSTAAANATNPLSTFTTSGAVQGHIQIEVNGAKRWLAFLADPS